MRIDLVGTTADFRRFGPPQPLPINHLLCENRRTQGRIGEVGLSTRRDEEPRQGLFAQLPYAADGAWLLRIRGELAIGASFDAANLYLITHYPQPSRRGTKQEHTAVSAGLNDGAQQGAVSKGAQQGPVWGSLRNRGSVPGGGDALALAIRLCLPGLRRGASQLHQDPGALPVYRLSTADVGDRRNDFRGNQGAAVHLVSRHVPPHSEQGRHLQH